MALTAEHVGLIQGLHHITLVTANEEVNRRFYTEVLGLRRVKLTVNQDDVHHRHLFYADEKATTGSAITFFEWPELPTGTVGLGAPHHLSYSVGRPDALPRWISWLRERGVSVRGPIARDGRISIYLRDPDGVLIELTAQKSEEVTLQYLEEEQGRELPTVTEIGREMRLGTFDHASPLATDSEITV